MGVFFCATAIYIVFHSHSVKIYIPSIYTFHYQKSLSKSVKLTDFKFLCFDPYRDFQICKMLPSFITPLLIKQHRFYFFSAISGSFSETLDCLLSINYSDELDKLDEENDKFIHGFQ